MALSIDGNDVKVIGSIVAILAGFIIIVAGAWRADIALVTAGAGLLGAPGIVSAAATRNEETGGASDGRDVLQEK